MSIDDKIEKDSKTKEWLKRYLAPEILGSAGNFLGPWMVAQYSDNPLLYGAASALGGFVGFGTTLTAEQIVLDRKLSKQQGEDYGLIDAVKTTGKILAEITPGFTTDSFYRTPITAGAVEIFGEVEGVVIGKFVSDIPFYAQIIGAYEIIKKVISPGGSDNENNIC